MKELTVLELLKVMEIFKGGDASDDHIYRLAKEEFKRRIQFDAADVPSREFININTSRLLA